MPEQCARNGDQPHRRKRNHYETAQEPAIGATVRTKSRECERLSRDLERCLFDHLSDQGPSNEVRRKRCHAGEGIGENRVLTVAHKLERTRPPLQRQRGRTDHEGDNQRKRRDTRRKAIEARYVFGDGAGALFEQCMDRGAQPPELEENVQAHCRHPHDGGPAKESSTALQGLRLDEEERSREKRNKYAHERG
jgi:hypothetical protein